MFFGFALQFLVQVAFIGAWIFDVSHTLIFFYIFKNASYLLDFPHIIHNYKQHFIGFGIFVYLSFNVGFLSM